MNECMETLVSQESGDLAPQLRQWLADQAQALIGQIASHGLRFAARDGIGNVLGGITGSVAHSVLTIHLLALAPEQRRRGIGSKLMRAIEDAAIALGCTAACVDTLEFEAPLFYQKQGYTLLGIVGDIPGRRKYFLGKPLRAVAAEDEEFDEKP